MTNSATTSLSAAGPRPARLSHVASLRYYICVALLIASAAGMHTLAQQLGATFRKRPVELKESLALIDWQQLEPRYRLHLVQPARLDEEMVQKLGTDEYAQVRLVDTTRKPTDATRVASVFITYYTGQPDMVPHVPDECYLAGGYEPLGRPSVERVPIPKAGIAETNVPVRVVEFQSPEGADTPAVLYFFEANGALMTNRNEVRVALANLLERYAYFAKIEINFTSDADAANRLRSADRAEALVAIQPLLERLLPLLRAQHFAWDQVTSGVYAERNDE